jgi:hypothetical protein
MAVGGGDPKNSFESGRNYLQALMEIPWRLADRMLSRSADQMELAGGGEGSEPA